MAAASLLSQAATLFRAAPIRELKLYEASTGMLGTNWPSRRYLARVQTLDLEKNELGDADLEILAGSAHLGELTTLLLWYNHLGDAACAVADASSGAAPG